MDEEDGSWTIRRDPGDGARGRGWRVGPRAATLVLATASLLLFGSGLAAGIWWQSQRAQVRTRELRATVERLRAERGRTEELEARLDSIEARYARLRSVMTGEVARSSRDVVLPAAPRAVAPTEGRERAEAGWSWPLTREGFVTRSFGSGEPPGHPGVDVAVPTGSYVRAARAGVVESAGTDPVYGLRLRVRHDGELVSLYGHASWLFAAEGDSVERGEVIALSGSTGRSTAPHLYFGIVRDGAAVDPLPVLGGVIESGDGASPPTDDNREDR